MCNNRTWMNVDLLKTSLHIDRLQMWNGLNELVNHKDHAENGPKTDITREYYINLITNLLAELKSHTGQDSNHVQTESNINEDDVEQALEIMKNNNQKLNNYWGSVSTLMRYPNNNVLIPSECLQDYNWNVTSNLIQKINNNSSRFNFDKFVELLEENEALLVNVIASQHLMLLSHKNVNYVHKFEDTVKVNLKGRNDECSRLKLELDRLKSENDRLNIRLELYRSELTRIYNESQTS